MQVRTGVKVWGYQFGANVINASPVMEGTYVYCTHGEENPDVGEKGRVICVDAAQVTNGQPKLVWEVDRHHGRARVAAAPRRPALRPRRRRHAALLRRQDRQETLEVQVRHGWPAAPRSGPTARSTSPRSTPTSTSSRTRDASARSCTTSSSPAQATDWSRSTARRPSADGKVIFGTRDELYCLARRTRDGGVRPRAGRVVAGRRIAAAARRGASRPGRRPTPRSCPADVTLAPGGSVTFKLRLFDKDGNFVKESPAEWSLPLPPKTPTGLQPPPLKGEIKDGVLTVAKELPGQQGYVDAKADGLTARARVRVAPQLPYKNDFEKVPVGATPGGWVNSQGKFAVVDQNGNKVLKKLATNSRPPLSRANAYIGLPTMKDYVIQADLSATFKNDNLPDMGIVNCRYTLSLMRQQAAAAAVVVGRPDANRRRPSRSRGRPATGSDASSRSCRKGDSAVVRGKVWPRDKPEPKEWTIEVTDPRPNREGSPGLYGYATGILDEIGGRRGHRGGGVFRQRERDAAGDGE